MSWAAMGLCALGCGGASAEAAPPQAPALVQLGAPVGGSAATREQPLILWEVRDGGRLLGHLHGSVHMLEEGREAAPSDHPVEIAFREAEALVVEVNPLAVDAAETQRLTMSLGLYPSGDDLSRHLRPEVFTRVQQRSAEFGLAAQGISRMRPWLLSLSLLTLEAQRGGFSAQEGVDVGLLARASSALERKEIIELETAEGQLRMLAGIPEDVQVMMLEDALGDTNEQLARIVEVWRSGDVEGLVRAIFEPLLEQPELLPFYEAMFFERNRRMSARLAELFATGRRHFVVIGAGHLVGPGSVVELLEERGLAISQVSYRIRSGARGGASNPDGEALGEIRD
ncbi:MAG: TraB/GumN family protein [Myxococcales bacterium]|nr:TraB/GumN family protein [Myxococcales bacterium]